MTILIRLTCATELASYEGCALALTLATFGHDVQLYLHSAIFGILLDPNSRLHGMIKSLDLYDIPKAWLADDNMSKQLLDMAESSLSAQLQMISKQFNSQRFEQILTF